MQACRKQQKCPKLGEMQPQNNTHSSLPASY